YKRAVEEGAMALFGEKYGDEVRVVSFGEGEDEEGHSLSMELCGGTHVDSTAEIGGFRVVSEGSVAAGVRRIEVVTGRGAEALTEQRLRTLEHVADTLHTKPDDVESAALALQEQNQKLLRELAQLRQKLAQQNTGALLDQAVQVNGIRVLAVPVEVADADGLRQMTDWLRDRLGSSVVVVGAVLNEKPQLVAAVTPDLVKRGVHAGNLVRDAAKIMGGGGGGRPDMAQAGGKDASKLAEALAGVPAWVEKSLEN
ncbi:MAG: alanine--tRNA ligase, partial [Caldilineaceae bacterium]|nr:alanine--tRNA ligase [Caldilineaceae bacterium]